MIGGLLGDRFNRRTLIFVTMMAATPFCWLMLHSNGILFALSAVLAGIFLSMANSPILVMTQEMAPQRRGLVGGLVLGFMFASGSAVAWIAGMASDTWGLEAVLSLVALMPAMGALVALMLPSGRTAPAAGAAVVSTSAAAD
jgi:FSR family fosmidomycin resistance protein-like MFS transporter